MRTSLKLCTMKSLPVLKKNSNTQGCRSLLEVGKTTQNQEPRKLRKLNSINTVKRNMGFFWHAEPKSGLSFVLLCFLVGFWPLFVQIHIVFAGLPPNAKFQGKARQSDFPEYTSLGIQILPSNLAQEQIEGICIRAQQSLQYVIK